MNDSDTGPGGLSGRVYQFNWYLLCLIFITVLLGKLLKSWSPVLCEKVSICLVNPSSQVSIPYVRYAIKCIKNCPMFIICSWYVGGYHNLLI